MGPVPLRRLYGSLTFRATVQDTSYCTKKKSTQKEGWDLQGVKKCESHYTEVMCRTIPLMKLEIQPESNPRFPCSKLMSCSALYA